MTTIPSTRTAPWAICHRSCIGKEDRQLKTASGTGLQGEDHQPARFFMITSSKSKRHTNLLGASYYSK
jgi:hypothetical protein